MRVHCGQARFEHHQRLTTLLDEEEIVAAVRPSVVVSVLDELIAGKVISGQRLVRRTEDVARLNSIGPRNGRGYSVPDPEP